MDEIIKKFQGVIERLKNNELTTDQIITMNIMIDYVMNISEDTEPESDSDSEDDTKLMIDYIIKGWWLTVNTEGINKNT